MKTKERTENILRKAIMDLVQLVPEDLENPNGFDLMKVIGDVKSVYLSIGPTNGEKSRSTAATERESIGSDKFRYKVRGGQLVRIGNLENGGVYEQAIDEDRFFDVVASYQALLERNPRTRVRATEVSKDSRLSQLPYYQVNLSCTFLWDSRLPQKCAGVPSGLISAVRELWDEMQRQP